MRARTKLDLPEYIKERGEIVMALRKRENIRLDIAHCQCHRHCWIDSADTCETEALSRHGAARYGTYWPGREPHCARRDLASVRSGRRLRAGDN